MAGVANVEITPGTVNNTWPVTDNTMPVVAARLPTATARAKVPRMTRTDPTTFVATCCTR